MHHDQLPADIALDRAALRHADLDHYGSSALHGIDPFEIAARIEDLALDPAARHCCEREALRREIFSGFIEYAFADGPDPLAVRVRIAGFIRAFSLEVHAALHGQTEWVTPDDVRVILRKPSYAKKLRALAAARAEARLNEWVLHIESETDRVTVTHTISAIITLLTRESTRWKSLVACAFALAKAYHPHLLAGMSLHDIAILCGDSGRATPSDRIKRLHNRRLYINGAKATNVPFQKTTTTVKKYRKAQLGNHNRTASTPPPKKHPKHHP